MSIAVAQVERVFNYGGRLLPDPDPSMTPAQVKEFYANIHPDLLNAEVDAGTFEGERQVFRFERAVGTKG